VVNAVAKLIELDNATKKNILVIGDVMSDRWVYGITSGCQEECDKFVQTSAIVLPGGAALAAEQFRHWNVCPSLNANYPIIYVSRKVRYVNQLGHIVFRIDEDAKVEGSPAWDITRAHILTMLEPAWDAVLISDYDKGLLTPDFIYNVIHRCNMNGIPVVVDAKQPPEVYKGAILKCNCKYWNMHRGVSKGMTAVITSGASNPHILMDGKWIANHNKLPEVKCVNFVGAGDCFAAHLVLGLAHGFTLEESTIVAHSAGRVYVQHGPGQPPHPSEIAADLGGVLCNSR
jgi:bifunctional ADP-heptose synthase (sugar kinase/adenylyltransferase)